MAKITTKYRLIGVPAEILGFNCLDIDNMLDQIKNNTICRTVYGNDTSREIALRTLIVRMNLTRNEFYEKLDELSNVDITSYDDIEQLRAYSGLYSLAALIALTS